ncbi:MAG: HhH-GPD-type base excision DNA repair protein [Mycobacteriales bacterium]
MAKLVLAQDPEADELLARDPVALLIGMLLDQQIPMQRAFSAPLALASRLGRESLDAAEIASYDLPSLVAVFSKPPALHRFPAAMAARVQDLARVIVADYGGDAAAVWREAADGAALLSRLEALPGFGRQKSQIFLALLGKQLRVRPRGWRTAAGAFGQAGVHKSVADITDSNSLELVRAYKQGRKRGVAPQSGVAPQVAAGRGSA